ncbi:CbtA family protein [Edaphobacter modestus]|uniref:Putative cobalt transporter subunit CbtA n=1 Tax=Edaphobacter modestus TaxID=388466 RepID=A0A4Q7YRL8_9BACT|nr:CbtA family protein [Edaphobacter modestus]RZU40150.1 putative cobalt transporter subunit CbtA [Edaphobacter modestus]
MTRTLLVRGMLVGLVAGLFVFAFARWTGEPQVDRAIAFETSMDHAKGESPEPEMVSRRIQRGIGLLTGSVVYSSALGGIFGLVFAFSQGRFGFCSPRALALRIAGLGFVSVALIPSLKYPASPPSVGSPETIGIRTAAYFLAIALSLAAMIFSLQLARRLTRRFGVWNGSLLAVFLFFLLTIVFSRFLPAIDEVPPTFPASLLWKFRIASWEMQLLLWSTLGVLFGWLTERDRNAHSPVR